jgi:hypothetical protein
LEELSQADGKILRAEDARHFDSVRIGSRVIFPRCLFLRIGDPAGRDTPFMVLLAFGESSAEAVFRGKDFYT